MKQTKKITVSSMCIALGVLFMTLGAYVEVLDLTAAAISSCLMAFVFIEIGQKYAFSVWLGTSLLGFVLLPGLTPVTYFLVFGIYPILKAYIERLKKPLWIPVKLVAFTSSSFLIILASTLMGIPFFSDTLGVPFFENNMNIFRAIVIVLIILAMYVYDIFMTVMIRAYFSNFRKRIQRILK